MTPQKENLNKKHGPPRGVALRSYGVGVPLSSSRVMGIGRMGAGVRWGGVPDTEISPCRGSRAAHIRIRF